MPKPILRRPKTTALTIAALAAGVAVAGCGAAAPTTKNVADYSKTSKHLQTVTLIYDWPTIDFGVTQLVVGEDRGIYAKYGIKLKIVAPPNNSTTVKMLAVGRGDIGIDTTADVVFAAAEKIPVISIANYSQSNNWGLFAPPGKKVVLRKLKGGTISTFGDAETKAMTPYVLKAAHLKASQVKQVVFPDDDIVPMLDGKVLYATDDTNYAEAEVQDATGKKPGVLLATKLGAPNIPVWVYTSTKSWSAAHPALTKAFLAATKAATAWAIAHPKAAATDYVKAYPNNGFSEKFNLYGWEDTVPYLNDGYGLLVQRSSEWSEAARAFKADGAISKALPASDYFTNSYVP